MRRRVVFFTLLAVLCWSLAGCLLARGQPKLEYRPDPTNLVIDVFMKSFWPPFKPEGSRCNYTPELRVWGDDWAMYSQSVSDDGKRVVKAGSLSAAQVQGLLQTIADSGFFRKHTFEGNAGGMYSSMRVNLKSGSYSSDWSGPPEIVKTLYKILNGMNLPLYTPEKGLLFASPCGNCSWQGAPPEWPAGFGFGLAQAEGGGWITGEALALVWQTTNTTYMPAFRDGNQDFLIDLEIPDRFWEDQPVDCWVGGSFTP